jgi:hypothetical protein
MLRAEERMLNNLKGTEKVESGDDFMKWTNRQLYLEKEANDRFNSMGIKVGDKTYNVAKIQEIPGALKEQYIDYWDNEFSEKQRQEMWVKLGLAPSNYVYIKAWEEKEKALAKKIMTKAAIWNDENTKKNERKKEIMDSLAADKDKPEDKKMGEKEIAQYNLEVTIDTNNTLRNIALDMAEKNELDRINAEEAAAPPNPPRLSQSYNYNGWDNITEE